jgi:hypothetical protein
LPTDYAVYEAEIKGLTLEPHFGVQHTRESPCPHRGDYAEGSHLVCMKCHRSGHDRRIGKGTKDEAARRHKARLVARVERGEELEDDEQQALAEYQAPKQSGPAKFKPRGRPT